MFIPMKLAVGMVKKKKVQSLLICIILTLISSLVYVGISVINHTDGFETMFERAYGAEDTLILLENNPVDEITSWWNQQEMVKDTKLYKSHLESISYGTVNQMLSTDVFITEYVPGDIDLLYKNDTEVVLPPSGNEMYLNYNFAAANGIELGDLIIFDYMDTEYSFEVTELIVDPQYSSPLIATDRCFIRTDFFSDIGMINNAHMLAVKYNSSDVDSRRLYDTYQEEITETSIQYYLDYESVQNGYNTIIKVTASMLLVVGFLMLITSMFVVNTTIKQTILQNYKQIGVKKVIGFSEKQIRFSFVFQYGLIAAISSIIGSFLGMPIRNLINSSTNYDIQVNMVNGLDFYLIITPVIVISVILFFTGIATKKAVKVKPIQAIKYGMPEIRYNKNDFSIINKSKWPLIPLISVKNMLSNHRKSLSIVMIVTLLVFVAVVIGNIGYTIDDSEYFLSKYTGMKIGDFNIELPEDSVKSAFEIAKKMNGIDRLVYFNAVFDYTTTSSTDTEVKLAERTVYGDYQEEDIQDLTGRLPSHMNEIVITSELGEVTEKTIGDYISVESDDITEDYLIVGQMETINNTILSYFKFSREIPETLTGENGYCLGYGDLDITQLDQEVKRVFGEHLNVNRYNSGHNEILKALSLFPAVIMVLKVLFLVVSCIVFVNLTISDVNHSMRTYGIMKAIGFSNEHIIKTLTFKSFVITSIGILTGTSLSILTLDFMMDMLLKLSPFSSGHIPILFDYNGTAVVSVLFILIGLLGTIIPARRVKKISPKQLLSE